MVDLGWRRWWWVLRQWGILRTDLKLRECKLAQCQVAAWWQFFCLPLIGKSTDIHVPILFQSHFQAGPHYTKRYCCGLLSIPLGGMDAMGQRHALALRMCRMHLRWWWRMAQSYVQWLQESGHVGAVHDLATTHAWCRVGRPIYATIPHAFESCVTWVCHGV